MRVRKAIKKYTLSENLLKEDNLSDVLTKEVPPNILAERQRKLEHLLKQAEETLKKAKAKGTDTSALEAKIADIKELLTTTADELKKKVKTNGDIGASDQGSKKSDGDEDSTGSNNGEEQEPNSDPNKNGEGDGDGENEEAENGEEIDTSDVDLDASGDDTGIQRGNNTSTSNNSDKNNRDRNGEQSDKKASQGGEDGDSDSDDNGDSEGDAGESSKGPKNKNNDDTPETDSDGDGDSEESGTSDGDTSKNSSKKGKGKQGDDSDGDDSDGGGADGDDTFDNEPADDSSDDSDSDWPDAPGFNDDSDDDSDDSGSSGSSKKNKNSKSKSSSGGGSSSGTEDADGESDDDPGENDSDSKSKGSGKGQSSEDSSDDEDSESGGEGDREDDEDDEEGSGQESSGQSGGKPKVKDGKILQNPFGPVGQLPQDLADQVQKGQLQIEDEIEAIIRIISGLSGDARRGALDALFKHCDNAKIDASAYKNESLITTNKYHLNESITKTLDEMSDDEFWAIYNDVFDTVKRMSDPGEIIETPPIQGRLKKVKSDFKQMADEMQAEDEENHKRAVASEESKKDLLPFKTFGDFDDFLQTFEWAITSQVRASIEKDDADYSHMNRHTEDDTDILTKGDFIDDSTVAQRPVIQIYLDSSISFDKDDVIRTHSIVNKIKDLEDLGKIKIELYYFATTIYSDFDSARRDGLTQAWDDILDNIKGHRAQNVVIITDSDMEEQAANCGFVKVPGYVWYLWKVTGCASLPAHLQGMQGTEEYGLWMNNIRYSRDPLTDNDEEDEEDED